MATINAIEAKILSVKLDCHDGMGIKAADWQDDSHIAVYAIGLLEAANNQGASGLVALSIKTRGQLYVNNDGTLFLLPISLEGIHTLNLKPLLNQQYPADLCASCEKFGKTCRTAAERYDLCGRAKIDCAVTQCPDFVGKND